MRGLLVLIAVAACALPGCEDKKRQSAEEDAGPQKPKGKEGDKCNSQEDCEFGFSCAKDDKTCQTPQTIDCRSRERVCLWEGRCYAAERGGCMAKSDADCKKAKICEGEGRCSARDGRCVAATREDCQQLCARMGKCTPKDGRCIAASDEDCELSRRCEIYDQCKAKDGQCIKP
jgi:hypothetical protein